MALAEGTDRLARDEGAEAERRRRAGRLWEEYRPRVRRLAARLAGDPELAEDLTQEIGLKVLRSYGEFRGKASPFTWLYRIAVNVVLRHRQRRQIPTVGLDTPEAATLRTPAPSPESAVLAAELAPVVRAALDRLPAELRAPLVLRVYEELKYREIAAILEIPEGTVMSRLHAARRRLREELKGYVL